MNISRWIRLSLTVAFGYLCLVGPTWALSPVVQYQDLVCGSPKTGFRDGAFYEAKFDQPQGVAISNDHRSLYVTDTQNNRVRVVDLDHQNQVSTLTGTGAGHSKDGTMETAQFLHPACPVVLPDDRILVLDLDSRAIRCIDLKARTVSTLFPTAKSENLPPIWNMVYWPSRNSLYLSSPESADLLELDLKTLTLRKIFHADPNLAAPWALAVAGTKLYVSDRTTGSINEVVPPAPADKNTKTTPPFTLKKAGQATGPMALGASGPNLYAYQQDAKHPILRVLPDSAPLTFVSTSGYRLTQNPELSLFFFFSVPGDLRVTLLPDPDSDGRFYFNNTKEICSFRDLNFGGFDYNDGEDSNNLNHMHDFEYPEKKPPHTFRIMLVGRSYLYNTTDDHIFEYVEKDEHEKQNFLLDLAKKLEFSLNEKAALNDWPTHFEVLNAAMHNGANSLELWPYYVVPTLAKKYSVDLVILCKDDYPMFMPTYFVCPLNSDGIPQFHADPEFMLEPVTKRFASGPVHDLYAAIAKSPKFKSYDITQAKDGDFCFNIGTWTADPDVKEKMLALVVKPLAMTRQKIAEVTTSSGKPCRYEMWFFPSNIDSGEDERAFYRDACEKAGIPFHDLSDDFHVMNLSFGPLRPDPVNGGHFSKQGMTIFKDIVENELIRNQEIPTNVPEK